MKQWGGGYGHGTHWAGKRSNVSAEEWIGDAIRQLSTKARSIQWRRKGNPGCTKEL